MTDRSCNTCLYWRHLASEHPCNTCGIGDVAFDRWEPHPVVTKVDSVPAPSSDFEVHPVGTAKRLAELEAGEPNMRHPKIQAMIGLNARRNIELSMVEQLLDVGPECEFTSMSMEYWNSLHDRVRTKLLDPQRRIAQLEQEVAAQQRRLEDMAVEMQKFMDEMGPRR